MKRIILSSALLVTLGCATQPRNSAIKADSNRFLQVADFENATVGERVHLHQNLCHESKNETQTKTFKKCDKLRIAEGVVVKKLDAGGVTVELDRDVVLAPGMYFEQSGETVKDQ